MLWGDVQFNRPSRFIKEIPEDLLDVVSGEPKFINTTRKIEKPPAPRVAAESRQNDLAPLRPGTIVRSRAFGLGVIQTVSPQGPWHKATVIFKSVGAKKLIIEKAQLEIVGS